jgi:hypothetical protein
VVSTKQQHTLLKPQLMASPALLSACLVVLDSDHGPPAAQLNMLLLTTATAGKLPGDTVGL